LYTFPRLIVCRLRQIAARQLTRLPLPQRTEVRVLHAESLPFEDARFDSVVDTYSLCSVRDPVKMLQEMQRVCRPGISCFPPSSSLSLFFALCCIDASFLHLSDGQILLLEHGRSQWRLVNWYLDLLANAHARSWGCWWNRSIADLLRESHLEVVEHRTRHFGTTHLIVARPAAKEIKQSKS
jgi:methyltransferase OMS1